MSQCHDRPIPVARRRGHPVNSDSAETRNRILRASRLVINDELVREAKDRGELGTDTAIGPVVEMLHAMFLGVGFYAGFVTDPADLCLITAQLDRTVSRGLPTRRDTGRDTPSAVRGRP